MKQLRIPETTPKRKTALLAVAAILLFAAPTASSQTYMDLYDLGSHSGDPLSPSYIGIFAQGAMATCTAPHRTEGLLITVPSFNLHQPEA